MAKKLYLVETVSIFRMRYVVEAKEEGHAADEFIMNIGNENWEEFSQHHVDECITSTREISEKEYLKLYDKDNPFFSSWTDEQKLRHINRIDYKK
jgi:hypothetical protein